MSGYNMIIRIKRLEEELEDMGLRWGHSRDGWGDTDDIDRVSIYPRGEELPVYARDACLFTGTIGELERWMQGVTWARNYDMLLKISDHKKRDRKEQDERNRQMVQRIKQEQINVKQHA
jgi:hypothetical protein